MIPIETQHIDAPSGGVPGCLSCHSKGAPARPLFVIHSRCTFCITHARDQTGFIDSSRVNQQKAMDGVVENHRLGGSWPGTAERNGTGALRSGIAKLKGKQDTSGCAQPEHDPAR